MDEWFPKLGGGAMLFYVSIMVRLLLYAFVKTTRITPRRMNFTIHNLKKCI